MTAPRVLLALDVGDARIGVAISRSGMIAQPLGTIERNSRTGTLDAIESMVREHGVTQIVVGLPVREDGVEGTQAAKTRAFARSLKRRLPAVHLAFFDERYSSVEAGEISPTGHLERGRIDKLAAAVILRDFLARESRTPATRDGESPRNDP